MKKYNLDSYGDTDKNFALEVAQGNIEGYSHVSLVGRSSAVGSKFQDIGDITELSVLDYDTQTGNFTAGLVITGATSTATATIVIDDDSGATGTLTIRDISGTFQNGEIITDTSTGSATTNSLTKQILALTYPTTGETWEVVCESLDDTSGGSGARTILVSYLDDTYTPQTEIIILNGQTAVTFTATDSFRFISAIVLTWGNEIDVIYGKSNLGSIVIRDSSSLNVMGLITYDDSITDDEHGFNNTQDIHYTVPAGKTSFPVLVLTNVTKNHDVTVRVLVRGVGSEGFTTLAEMGNYQNTFTLDISNTPAALPEKTDVKFIARSNNTAVSVIVELFLTEINN